MENHDARRRQAIKKRLSDWASLFEKIESGKYLDNEDDKAASIIDDSLCDPTFIAVDQEHSKVREALCVEHGITQEELLEPLPKSDDEDSCDEVFTGSSSDSGTSDSGKNDSCRASSIEGSPIREDQYSSIRAEGHKNSPNKMNRMSKLKVQRATEQQNVYCVEHTQKLSQTKQGQDVPLIKEMNAKRSSSTSVTALPIHRHLREILPSPHTPPKNERRGYRCFPREDRITGNSSDHDKDNIPSLFLKHAKELLPSPKIVPKDRRQKDRPESAVKCVSLKSPCRQQNHNEEEVLSPKWTPKRFLLTSTPKEGLMEKPNISPDFNYSKDQSVRHHSAVELREQYALYKLYKRRKSGKFGSLHIVSSLDEELSDATHHVPSLPPVVKDPFKISRRFSLKKQVHW